MCEYEMGLNARVHLNLLSAYYDDGALHLYANGLNQKSVHFFPPHEKMYDHDGGVVLFHAQQPAER
jgi:hypothetical protein